MVSVHIGKKRALVFPVMCDGHLKLDYDANDSTESFWGYDGTFTFEAIVTPYDVNGLGHRNSGQGRLDSAKTPPFPNYSLDDHANTTSSYESVQYFGAGRNTHKMMLFHNPNFKVYLQNTTTTTFNQPSQYRIVVEIRDTTDPSNPITTVTTTNPIIRAEHTLNGYYSHSSTSTSLYNGFKSDYRLLDSSTTISSNTITASNSIYNILENGVEIFNSSGQSLGVISNIANDGSNTTFDVPNSSLHTSNIYYHNQKEALYLEQTYKISCVFIDSKTIQIYVNNSLIKTGNVSIGTFAFDGSDSYIGQDATQSAADRKGTQFMGEIHEIGLFRGRKISTTLDTLTPHYKDIMFYYSFGDV